MGKKLYESPRFTFQEMKLLERVADKCWGNGYAYVDGNKDGKITLPDEQYHFTSGGCEGNDPTSLENRLSGLLKEYPKLTGLVDTKDVATNINSKEGNPYIRPVVS